MLDVANENFKRISCTIALILRYDDAKNSQGTTMKIYDCSEPVRQLYAQIGSGDQAYIPKAIHCAIKTLDAIAADTSLPQLTRNQAAFAAANLLISDNRDNQ